MLTKRERVAILVDEGFLGLTVQDCRRALEDAVETYESGFKSVSGLASKWIATTLQTIADGMEAVSPDWQEASDAPA